MSITLKHQMETIFLHGLEVIRMNQKPVQTEWENIILHLNNADKKLEENVKATLDFFNTFLFKEEQSKNIIQKIEDSWELDYSNDVKASQFVITLLENAVHKVIQSQAKYSNQDHQAIQYLFTVISEQILTHPYHKHFSIESFLKNLVSSEQIPIQWVAIVRKYDKLYNVETWFNHQNHNLLSENDSLKANTMYALSDLLLMQMPEDNRRKLSVAPIPFHNDILLICTYKEDLTYMIPFVNYALQIFQKGKDTLRQSKQEELWKDSVIMFNEMIMQSHSYEAALENITEGFVNYLPFERCALFSYSYNEQMGFGLYGQRLDISAIQNITEDISNLPIIQNNLQILEMFGKNVNYLQPVFIENAKLGFPAHYIKQFQLKTVVIVPIFTTSTNKLLGAAILDQGPDKSFKVAKETFAALIKFGQSAGEILSRFYKEETLMPNYPKTKTIHFSPREVEVLQLMAEGASTNEAALELNLSEYTVRDYISSIMQKMDARNRTEAVARAIRDGVI